MEDAMCYERDYWAFEEYKKAEAARAAQQRRAEAVEKLRNDANKPAEQIDAPAIKEIAPAK
jgi:hypothetical protein